MKIIKLKSENVKKLKAIEINFEDGITILSGKNGAGKSSVIDSIWFTLSGKDSLKNTTKPIREGQKDAISTVNLGDYIVTRNWTANDTSYLKVENKDGAKFPSPQALLDRLIGDLSFDPLEFARLDAKAQKQTLLKLLNIEDKLQVLEDGYKEIFDERTLTGRDWKAAKAQLEGMKKPDEKLPGKEIDIPSISLELKKATEHNDEIWKLEEQLKASKENEAQISNNIAELEKELKKYKESLKNIQNEVSGIESEIKSRTKINTETISKKWGEAMAINDKIKDARLYFAKKSDVEKLEAEGKAKTAELEKIKAEIQSLVTSSKMPIDGLAVDEDGVIFNDIPFAQLSSAEQLKVSLSIAMAMNPTLKDIFIRDGSLLDSSSKEVIKQLATEKGYDIIIEQVDETGKVGIYIEDGEVMANNYKQEVLV
ncbi:MAG: AAA family ATPase [Actinobacteria bacterium]|nr:AAA family ATPase [Actinomycetota bacterium]